MNSPNFKELKEKQSAGKALHNNQEHTPKTRKILMRTLKIFLIVLFSVLILGGSFFAWKIYRLEKKVTINTNPSEQSPSLVQQIKDFTNPQIENIASDKNGRTNILLVGMTADGYAGQGLTDTIMVASINPKTHNTSFISIPRDLYVEIPDFKVQTKINSVFNLSKRSLCENKDELCAVENLKKTVEEIVGLPIHYFLAINYDGFEKIVDSIGGINVMVQRDIYDSRYPGPGYSYETFELSKGLQHLDGKTALKYARERHSDPEGDFGRAKRQQQIISSVKNRIFSEKIFLNALTVNDLINSLGKAIITDIPWSEYSSFIEISKNINIENANNIVINAWDTDSLLKVSHIFTPEGQAMFILIPRVGNYSEIHELAQNSFDLEKIKRKKEEIEKENPQITVILNKESSSFQEKIRKLLTEKIKYPNPIFTYSSTYQTPDKTIVFDFASKSKPFSLDDLAKKFSAQVKSPDQNLRNEITGKNTTRDTDFAIIAGKDLINHLQYEEDTIDDLENNELENELTLD